MTINRKNLLLLLVAAGLFSGCTKDAMTPSAAGLNSSGTIVEAPTFTETDLVGTWKLVSMRSNIPVDLNFDQTSSTNILSETTCFDPMYFTFDASGEVTTGQAKLDFGENGNKFECGYGEYSARWELNGNELLIHFNLNGTAMSQVKSINLTNDTSGVFLHISLEDQEAAQYVDDPGNTVASNVERIETVYKKQ
ncbi:MAG TPA: lipocalin family protein [Salinimicrobium sp.]|nr:lipocalin family protein [Salinimicrobium sp.]